MTKYVHAAIAARRSMPEQHRAKRIADLNDSLRRTFTEGAVVVTAGIQSLGGEHIAAVLHGVRVFDAFNGDNDPHGEHDFGAISYDQHRIFWKIDYYDPSLKRGSEDPADETKTARVLTIMLASEY